MIKYRDYIENWKSKMMAEWGNDIKNTILRYECNVKFLIICCVIDYNLVTFSGGIKNCPESKESWFLLPLGII